MGLFSELRRRNVLRMAVLYVVAAWLIMQVAGVLIDLGSLPEQIGPFILPLLVIGFPIALIFSWFYEITPEGISLEKDVDAAESITHVTGRRLDFIVISLLCAAVIVFAYDKWWIGPPPEKSIAVLAFENMSADSEQEFFSDGISEELLNLLAKIPELDVRARSSAFSFKGKDVAVPEIAARLNVAHVLEGSVRRDGNRVRVTAQLIEASTDSHLWSESYDRDLDDIFAVQEEIASSIGDALKLTLVTGIGGAKQPVVIRTASMDAYDAYLRGRELIHLRIKGPLEDAIRHLKHSLRLDDNFAPAHAQLAIATALLVQEGATTPEEASRFAILHLDRAQELAPDLAEAHGGRALLAILSNDPESTIEHARKALASNPGYSDAMVWLGNALGALGRYEELDPILEQILVTDPFNLVARFNYAEWLGETGRVDEAHEMADQLLAENPIFGYQAHAWTSFAYEGEIAEGLYWGLMRDREELGSGWVMAAFAWVGEYDEARRITDDLAYVYRFEGRLDEAIQLTQETMRLKPNDQGAISDAAYTLYLAGRLDEALPQYERLLDFVYEGRPIPGYLPIVQTMRLALARREAGDEEGAQAAVQIARQDHAARHAAGRKDQQQYLAEAMIAAFEDNTDRVIPALKSGVQHGLRYLSFFDDPIFEDLRDEPRFVALKEELDEILAEEHDKALQLICFNNPTPENWQPLPETCEGVVDRGRHE